MKKNHFERRKSSSPAKVAEWDGQRETLDDLALAVHYNQWINHLMEPYLGKRILEVGCGIGNMTSCLADRGEVLAMDFHQDYLDTARMILDKRQNVRFKKMDLSTGLGQVRSFRADTVVCVNVLEHIQNDSRFLMECHQVLQPGGKFLLFVPALQFIYGSMDRSYGHHRRYYKNGLERLFQDTGFNVHFCRYLNLLGIFGWWFNGQVLRRPIVPRNQMMIYDQIVRWTGLIEQWLPRPIGLSLFCVGVKN